MPWQVHDQVMQNCVTLQFMVSHKSFLSRDAIRRKLFSNYCEATYCWLHDTGIVAKVCPTAWNGGMNDYISA